MSAYLMIQNRGVCPPEGFTVLGASTTRNESNNPYSIGCFGSGGKHSLSLLLRHNLKPVIFCSNLRMDFSVRPMKMEDGLSKSEFGRIVVKYGGKDNNGQSKSSTEDLGFVTEFGQLDWASPDFAIREFVSNAIDREIRQAEHEFAQRGEAFDTLKELPWKNVLVEVVNENQVRAKQGYTRVFIPLTPVVLEFYNNLNKWFLHFAEPESLAKTILYKKDRNLSESKKAVIYRRGVLVREFGEDVPSLFDYNINDLSLDESRKVNDSTVRHAAGRALSNASSEILSILLKTWDRTDVLYWEKGFSHYELVNTWETGSSKERKDKAWGDAYLAAFEAGVVLCDNARDEELLTRKGHKPKRVSSELLSAARHYRLKTAAAVLNADERLGRQIDGPLDSHLVEAQRVWSRLRDLELTRNKQMPAVFSFMCIMDAEQIVFGFQRDEGIYLNKELSGVMLTQTLLEEFAHWVSGSGDLSRDFQNYAFSVAAHLMAD